MKKVLSLVLAVVMALGVSAAAFGAMYTMPNKKNNKEYVTSNFTILGLSGGNPESVAPDTSFEFLLQYSENGQDYAVTRHMVSAAKIGVQSRVSAGSSVLKKPEIIYKDLPVYDSITNKLVTVSAAYVKFETVETFVSTKEQDFEIDIYLTADKSRLNHAGANVNVYNTLENASIEVTDSDDYVYTYDYPVVEADDYIRNIQVDMGNGVSIYTKMFDGKKYYAKSERTIKTDDEAILAKYADIQDVYYLYTIGLNGSGNIVDFDIDENMYVYTPDADGNLQYIGRSTEKLPYYSKYYLSVKELPVDMAGNDVDAPSVEPNAPVEGDETPNAGGDDAPINANDNPSTGF